MISKWKTNSHLPFPINAMLNLSINIIKLNISFPQRPHLILSVCGTKFICLPCINYRCQSRPFRNQIGTPNANFTITLVCVLTKMKCSIHYWLTAKWWKINKFNWCFMWIFYNYCQLCYERNLKTPRNYTKH